MNIVTQKTNKKIISFCIECKKEKTSTNQNLFLRCHSCSNKLNRKKEILKNKQIVIPKEISVEKTIEKFGYNPQYLLKGSSRYVIYLCSLCNKEKETEFRTLMRARSEQTCHPCNIIKFNKKQKITASARMIEYYKNNKHHQKGKNNHRYGKPATNGKGAWYTTKENNKIWMRSSWETKFAQHLDNHNIKWSYEPEAFPITYTYKEEIKESTFTPDFLLNEEGEYIELKGWWRGDSKEKFESFKQQYPNVHISLYMKKELQNIGIL